jgi:hypothetical protein
MKELKKSPAGFTSALPHSLANIRDKKREKPITIGIFLRAIQQSAAPHFVIRVFDAGLAPAPDFAEPSTSG